MSDPTSSGASATGTVGAQGCLEAGFRKQPTPFEQVAKLLPKLTAAEKAQAHGHAGVILSAQSIRKRGIFTPFHERTKAHVRVARAQVDRAWSPGASTTS